MLGKIGKKIIKTWRKIKRSLSKENEKTLY